MEQLLRYQGPLVHVDHSFRLPKKDMKISDTCHQPYYKHIPSHHLMEEIEEIEKKYEDDSDMILICNTAKERLIAGDRPTTFTTLMNDESLRKVQIMPDLNDAQKERIKKLQWQIEKSRDFTEGPKNFMGTRRRVEGEELRLLRRNLAFVRLGGALEKLQWKPRPRPWW